jgi:hypothetical protein
MNPKLLAGETIASPDSPTNDPFNSRTRGITQANIGRAAAINASFQSNTVISIGIS